MSPTVPAPSIRLPTKLLRGIALKESFKTDILHIPKIGVESSVFEAKRAVLLICMECQLLLQFSGPSGGVESSNILELPWQLVIDYSSSIFSGEELLCLTSDAFVFLDSPSTSKSRCVDDSI